ncbi:MAG: hypothetical protein J0H74_24605 [Chitinophagaceae bacterium]|nr:hypothetical protein [Chitinophagaceae bacterium]
MIKRNKRWAALILLQFAVKCLIAHSYGVIVTTTAIPPVNPMINQAILSSQINTMLLNNVVGAGSLQVVVLGKIECLSPSPFSIALNPTFATRVPPMTLAPAVPTQMNATQLSAAFADFNPNYLVATGIDLTTVIDANHRLTLPAGTYRICFAVMSYSVTGGPGSYLSDPNNGCGTFTIGATQPAGGVIITTQAIPPANAVILRSILGGGVRSLVQFNNPGGGPTQVKLFGKIECLSPSPFTLSLNPGYQQQAALTLTPGVPLQLSAAQLLDAFGQFSQANLVSSGIALNSLTDPNNNLKLPDGTYRLCLYARYVTPNGLGGDASSRDLGCGTFTVCTKASAPQFTQPVNNFSLSSSVATVMPGSPMLFSWTAPNATCGGILTQLNYDLEIHELLSSQTVTDAINNPFLYKKTQLNTPNFLLDTLLNRNVLQQGKQYVIRVRAYTNGNSSVEFDNSGYSRIEAFQYGNSGVVQGQPPLQGGNTPNNNPPIDATGADCGLVSPSNTTLLDKNTNFSGVSVKVGEFTLVPGTIKAGNDGTFSGDGTIEWSPLGVGSIKLSVVYDKIKINSSKELIDGVVTSSTNRTQFQNATFSSFKDVAGKTGPALDKLSHDVEDFINNNAATHLVSQITGSTPVDFPIGLNQQDMSGTPVTLAIMSMVFGPKGATMSVLMNVNIPEANGWLSLAGTNICVKPAGASFSQGTLFLPADRDFNIGSGGNNLNIKFKGCPSADSTSGTYVSWANNKLSEIVVHAEMSLPRNAVVPEDPKGEIQGGAVVAKILFSFHEWEDWVASLDLPHFQIAGVSGLSFQASTIFYDHSSKRDASSFEVPDQYTKPAGGAFEGLYIKDLKVLLPSDFKTFNNSTTRTSFDAHNFIIDDKGVSASLQGSKIIDLSTGNLGGWAFSLDSVGVLIVQNTFKSGGLNGQILLPISSTPLAYQGDLHVNKDSLQYEFVIQPADNMKFDIWKAYVQLNKNSAFQVKKDDKGAAVSVILNGTIGFDISDGSPSIKFDAIKFDSLGMANRNPSTKKDEFWYSAGTWALASPQKSVGGFPISLNDVTPYMGNDNGELKMGVKFGLNLDLGFGDKSVISVGTNIGIYGKLKVGMAGKAPSIDLAGFGIDVDSVKVKGDVGPVNIDGYIAFYKRDNTYGDGLKGHVEAKFPLLTAEATVQFGNVNNYNYWYVDGCVTLPPPGLAVGAGMVSIVGFGGGAYYNMEMTGNLPADPAHLTAATAPGNHTPGTTLSGVTFVPKLNSAGIRATVCIGLSSPDVMNAKVTMTGQIQNGALQELDLNGDIYVMTDFPDNSNATVHGVVDITYDFAHNKFNLNADIQAALATVKVDIPIGLYAGPDGWYFKLGDAFGKRVSFTLLDAQGDLFSAHIGATAYMMMGSLINPNLPDLPVELTSFGVQRDPSVDKFVNSLNKADGAGFMFGARVDGSVGFNFAFLYAKVKAILGFDLALKNFSNFTCGGKSAGWNNWYALGQMYFYFDLDVGIHVDVWFYSGDLSLVQFKAGAVLSGGLPNPTWLDGSVHVQGSVLDGLVKVNTSAHFSIGDKCYPSPDPLKDIKIISDYGPKDKSDVFDLPFAAANVPLNVNFDILVPPTSAHPDGETRTYRFDIYSFKLRKHSNGQEVQGGTDYSNGNQTVTLKRTTMLEGRTQYDAEIVCNVRQLNPNTYVWEDPYNDKDGRKEAMQEITRFSFVTGPAPDYIPDGNVHFAYPVDRQRYVLKQEMGGAAVIAVNQWQDNILKDDANKFNINVRNFSYVYFIDVNGSDTLKTNFTPDRSTNTLRYTLPAGLKNNTTYRAEFWSVQSDMNMKLNLSLLKGETTRNYNGAAAQIRQTSVAGMAKLNVSVQRPIYTYYFRTSAYNTFSDKINAFGNWTATATQNGLAIAGDGSGPESFDKIEARGFQSPDGTTFPAMFQVNVPWDRNRQNDAFADNNLYGNAFVMAFFRVTCDFGAREIRGNSLDDAFKPVGAVDWWSGLSVQPPLNNSEAGIKSSVNPISQDPKATFSTRLSGGISLYAPFASKLSSAGMFSAAAVNINPRNTIFWNREKYLWSDFDMMKGFGFMALLTEGAYKIDQMSPGDADQAFGNLDGDYTFISNKLGGSVSIPWNMLYHLYQTPSNITMFHKLMDMQYTGYPRGSRTMQFSYQAGSMRGGNVSKTFNY